VGVGVPIVVGVLERVEDVRTLRAEVRVGRDGQFVEGR
jgi:hypothetical protein